MSRARSDSGTPPPRQSPSPLTSPVPLLGVLVDRTSFDETDSYGVDREVIETSDWVARPGSQAIVMKNGKVRRKLRWRPKSMMKNRRSRPRQSSPSSSRRSLSNSLTRGRSSSNSSVASVSNASQSSKASRISYHSFASTETQVKSNTMRDARRRVAFPLPRPNYSSSLEAPTAVTMSSTSGSSENEAEPPSKLNGHSTTIVKASSSHEDEKKEEDFPSRPPRSSQIRSKRAGLPPLFRKPPLPNNRPRTNSASSIELSSIELSKDPLRLQTRSSSSLDRVRPAGDSEFRSIRTISSESSEEARHDASSVQVYRDYSKSLSPLPNLCDEEVERDRQVDLRIRKSSRSHSVEPSKRAPESLMGESMIEELRQTSHPTLLHSNSCPIPERTGRLPLHPLQTSTKPEKVLPLLPSMSVDPVLGPTVSGLSDISETRASTDTFSQGPTFGDLDVEFQDEDDLDGDLSDDEYEDIDEDDNIIETADSDMEHRFAKMNWKGHRGWTEQTPLPERKPPVKDCKSPRPSPHRPTHTVPVDLDDCCFLEAERNLQAIHEMATEHLEQGEYDEALEVFEEILRGQLARYGKEHARTGTALHNIGIVHMRRGDYMKAAAAYRDAVHVRKIALGPDHADVAVSLAQLGVAYLEDGKLKKAISAFREALKIRRRCLGPNHPKVGKILNNIGCALYELNALDVARVAFEEALQIQRHNLAELPVQCKSSSDGALLSIASTLSNIASIKLYLEQYDEACVDFQEALLIQQCVFGDDHPVPLQTEDSLAWIEKMRSEKKTKQDEAFDFFTMLKRSLSNGNCTKQTVDMERLLKGDIKGKSPSSPIDDGSTVTSLSKDHRGMFGTLERNLTAFQKNLDYACGPDDSDSEDDDDLLSAAMSEFIS